MNTKKVASAAATAPATEPESGCQPSFPIPILSDEWADVKVLRALQEMKVNNTDIVDTLRETYAGFDKSLLSKCRSHEKYGIRLISPAVRLLQTHFGIIALATPAGRRKPARQKPHRCQCRVTSAVYGLLQRRISQTGQTMQEYLEQLILKDLNEGGTK